MNIQSILSWLGSSAAPGWIAALIMLIGLIIQWLRGRQRPSRVIVEQILDMTLLSTPKDLREAERIRILYGEEPIDMLWMTELRVKNAGNTVISEPDIYIRVDNETKMLGVQLQGVPPSPELEETCSLIKENAVTVAYPYLNPYHEHKQETTIKVLCNRTPGSLTVEGGGKGWSVAFLSSANKEEVKDKVSWIVSLSLAASIIFVALGLVYVPFILLGFALLVWSIIAGPVLERWLIGRLR